ncbi:helix-turn-helix domain-containing protein [Mesonia aestuariivivens]|uniref:helix-turn-helix domain-containing protein n=1 Tax=Mesonia aestuariivivens TaxID=2796128 RepID=UPI0034E2FB6B
MKTSVTRYCSHKCNSKAYKERIRTKKIKKSNTQTLITKTQDIEHTKAKEFLNVNEVCLLIGISKRTVYRLFENSQLNKYKVGSRTIIKRSEIDKLFTTS